MTTTSETKNTQSSVKFDIQQTVTDTIIEQLEEGTVPWEKPWAEKLHIPFSIPVNPVRQENYQGINILLLWASGLKNGFTTNEWAGFDQWNKKKEFIRKGEKSTGVIFYHTEEKEIDGEMQKISYPIHLKVFNRCQLQSYKPDEVEAVDANVPTFNERIAEIDDFVDGTKAIIESHKGGAMYRLKSDKIMMPYAEEFKDTVNCTAQEGFYATLFHELGHWTGAKQRLDRINHKKFGDKNYAAEELAAEFTAAFLCAGFGIATLEKGNHAAYIDNWLQVLRNDKTVLFTASSAASKAVDYLMKLQPAVT